MTECPVSYISPFSRRIIEELSVLRLNVLSPRASGDLPAKCVDAMAAVAAELLEIKRESHE